MGSTTDDFQDFNGQYQAELDKRDAHTDRDRPHVDRFLRKQDGRVSTSSVLNYLRHLRAVTGHIDGSLIDLDEDAFDQLIFDLRNDPAFGRGDDAGYADSTVRIYQITLRKFLSIADRHVSHDLSWVEDIELVTTDGNDLNADDMLRDDDIAALTSAADQMRDIALIEFLADTGARLSLVGSLRVGDVDLDGERATYSPNPNAAGLKGADQREYPIIDSKASMRTYLNSTHPRPDRDDVAFFHTIPGHGRTIDPDGDGALTPQTVRRRLRKAAETAGVDKPVNPHNFRHSAVSRMRREGWSRKEVEHRVHWTVDSRMWETYEHIGGDEHNEAIWERVGVGETDETETAERRPCGNCREVVASWSEYCPNCGEPQTPEARQQTREATAETSQMTAMVDGDTLRVPASEVAAALARGEITPATDDESHD